MTGITLRRVMLWRICLANALLLDASLQGLLFSFQLVLAGRDGSPYWGANSRHMYLLCAALGVLFVLATPGSAQLLGVQCGTCSSSRSPY